MQGLILCLLSVLVLATAFKNPIFTSQDPWITYVDGVYYYSQSGCPNGFSICVKASKTLTDLGGAPLIGVWKAPASGPNSHDVWAPEMHYVNKSWYIYYAADDGNNNNHRLFVLQGDSPTGAFKEANTGLASGQLKESTGNWAIDPDVFYGVDGQLYITWSCTNFKDSTFPQRICLARMSDPVTISSATAFLSTPTESWETRGADIQEGPVGYTRNGHTYITYSGSASWISNDYSVGLLTFQSGDMLTPGNWVKSGPILDHHGGVYGPGSVVFTPSVDGSEYWVLYHAIEKDDCTPSAYACRDVRMQQMFFDPLGYPVLGYPVNPGVELTSPAGENGEPKGTTLIADWGDAWGDAAEGNPTNGKIAGKWHTTDRWTANSTTGGQWDQIFSPWNPNPSDFTAHVEIQHVKTGTTYQFQKYGFYCSYYDANNHAELFLDINYKVLASHAVVNGQDAGWQNQNLPANFDPSQWHSLDCIKSGNSYTFSLDHGAVMYTRSFDLQNGQTGLLVVDTQANFRNLQLYPKM